MRLLWLADVLRSAGLTVHEYPGWRERGASTFGPVSGIVCHGTGGSWTSTDEGELRVLAVTGSTSAPEVPISQLYLSRSGEWWVIASGTATGVRAGTAGPLKGLSDDAILQIEAQHASNEPWTDVQHRSYVLGAAALVRHKVPGYDVPVSRVVGHYEHQPNSKTDPWFDMGKFRADVAAVLNGDDMDQRDALVARTNTPGRTVGDVLGDLSNLRDGMIGAGVSVPGAKAGEWPRPGSPLDNLARLPGLLAEHAAAPVDPAALKAVLLDPEVLAAIAAAVVDEQRRRLES